MRMAKRRPRCSSPISSRMKGNFWTVEMMIFLPASRNRRRVAGALLVPHRRADLGVLPDGVADLPVEDDAVGDDDDRVEDRGAVLLEADQSVGQPGDGVALAAARRVLDQVAAAGPVRRRVGQQPAHHVELVVAGPDLRPLLPAGPLVLLFHDLGVVRASQKTPCAGGDPEQIARFRRCFRHESGGAGRKQAVHGPNRPGAARIHRCSEMGGALPYL